MADYYTHFSVVLPLTKEQQDYALNLVKQVEAYRDEETPWPGNFPEELKDEVEGWSFETEKTADGIRLHSENGGQESACVFIQHLLQKFEFAGAVAFEWSHDCSKPRIDAYGGGAAYVTSSEIETFSTAEWLRKMVHG